MIKLLFESWNSIDIKEYNKQDEKYTIKLTFIIFGIYYNRPRFDKLNIYYI